jgi:dolichol-phosphate mannosyltransferase
MLIIPTYNERANVDVLVSRIRKAAPREPIFFVDDNSPDGTADAIRSIQQRDPDIHLMARPSKGGYGSACRDAMRKILHEDLAPYVIQFDADLSHPPELLPSMIDALRTWPVAIGSRYVPGGGSLNWDFRRKCLSFGANIYARFLTGVPVHDMTSGFVGYQTVILREIDLAQVRSEGYAFLMEMKFSSAPPRRQVSRVPHRVCRARGRKVEVQPQDHAGGSSVSRESDDGEDASIDECSLIL